MDDLISRQAAIIAVKEHELVDLDENRRWYNHGLLDAEVAILGLPSAQPEQKKGKWIAHREKSREYIGTALVSIWYDYWFCDICGYRVENRQPTYNFCPNCGKRMVNKDG